MTAGEMALRTLIVYAAALAIVRLGSRRFLSQASAFDVIVAIMLGSVMSRAINGSAPFGATLVSGAVLVGLHWLIATAAYRLDWLGPIVKGRPVRLIVDGTVDHDVFAGSTMNTVSRETRTMATIAAATPSARKAREQPVQSRATTGHFRRTAARTAATRAAATQGAPGVPVSPAVTAKAKGAALQAMRHAATVRPDVWIPIASFKSENAWSPPMVSDLPSAEAQRRVQTDMASGGGAAALPLMAKAGIGAG